MRKILIVASVSEMIEAFLIPNIELLQGMGNEVHVMANFDDADSRRQERNSLFQEQLLNRGVVSYSLPIQREPFHIDNKEAYKQMKMILEEENFSIIHCHTPIGGVLTRLAARKERKKGTKVMYTAHGFHFFKGAPVKNWLIYYPIEKLLSRYTDCLITINQEDYLAALSNRFQAESVETIPGVGINPLKFRPVNETKRKYLREQYGYKKDEFILIYVAELSYRKNQSMLISMMPGAIRSIPNAKLLLVGDGDKKKEREYQSLIQSLKLHDHVKLLGFRRDINNLMALSDIVVSASRQEGLPVNVMEAMSVGLPLIVTDCRGNRDLVQDGRNGFVVGIEDGPQFTEKVKELYRFKEKRDAFGKASLNEIKKYSVISVNHHLKRIYETVLEKIEHEELRETELKGAKRTSSISKN